MTQRTIPPPEARGSRARRLSADEVTQLVRAAADGDQQSWNEIVREFGGLIWAVARGHRLGDADAAEVEQVTWMRLIDRLGDLRKPASLGVWLATTARRECLRLLRQMAREVTYGGELPSEPAVEEAVDLRIMTSERDVALWRCFGRLRTSDQALLRLLLADPRPAYEEIAAALDMPIGSIGPTRARALERLRQELDWEGALTLVSAA